MRLDDFREILNMDEMAIKINTANRLTMKRKVFIGLFILLTNFVSAQTDKKDYLIKVLNNLEQIKSATYHNELSSSSPGDTLAFNTYYQYVKEFKNLSDTFIYARYANFDQTDTTQLMLWYDGSMVASVNWNSETVKVDSFGDNPNKSFRPVMAPFFANVRGIIKYALNNSDSAKLIFNDYGDSLQFSLLIFDKIVEFNGKPINFDNPGSQNKGKISQYDVWINKSNNLPYRTRRKMPHQTSFQTCSNITINNKTDEEFIAAHFIPAQFKIVDRKNNVTAPSVRELEGKPAPDWILKDVNSKEYSLSKMKSKIIMIQFTGIGCGPCHASISFLKKLTSEYQNKNFQFISIESWSSNVDGIRRYIDMNNLNYLYLISSKEITKKYNVEGVPAFFILDKDRTIRKVILGYDDQGSTDDEIKQTLNQLL